MKVFDQKAYTNLSFSSVKDYPLFITVGGGSIEGWVKGAQSCQQLWLGMDELK